MWKILAGILYLGNIKYEEIPLGNFLFFKIIIL